jgi:AraC-like DNA-binding protein
VSATAVPRAFPTRVTDGLGLCLKSGTDHDVIANGRACIYPADTLCIRRPGCVWSSDAAAVGFLSVDVAPALLPEEIGQREMRFVHVSARDAHRFRKLVARLGSGDPLDRQEALTDLVGAAIPRAVREQVPSGAERLVVRVRACLRRALDEKTSLDDLAAEVATNKFVLLRTFHRLTGTTPHRYRTLVRVERARQLLARGAAPADVAVAVGFADQPHLSRAFRRAFGITPRAYDRSVRQILPPAP